MADRSEVQRDGTVWFGRDTGGGDSGYYAWTQVGRVGTDDDTRQRFVGYGNDGQEVMRRALRRDVVNALVAAVFPRRT